MDAQLLLAKLHFACGNSNLECIGKQFIIQLILPFHINRRNKRILKLPGLSRARATNRKTSAYS